MANFKQTFLIQAHTDSQSLFRLVNNLDSSNHYFAIHIDKKSQSLLTERPICQLIEKDNVLVISDYKINWGGANQFFATLRLIEKSVEKWRDIDYFHLISGQDFPTKDVNEIDEFFENHRHQNYMSLATNPHLEYRYEIFHPRDIINTRNCPGILKLLMNSAVFIQSKLFSFGIRIRKKIPLKIYKGSNWWSLNRVALDYITSFIADNPSFKTRFKYTNCCDEVFFQTILFNSPLKESIVTDDLRYIDWTENGRGFPNYLDETDYSKIIESNNFFCRKIIAGKSDKLVDMLEQRISRGI